MSSVTYQATTVGKKSWWLGRSCTGGCGKVFARGDRVVLREAKTNWFRGDDVVDPFCPDCHGKGKSKCSS